MAIISKNWHQHLHFYRSILFKIHLVINPQNLSCGTWYMKYPKDCLIYGRNIVFICLIKNNDICYIQLHRQLNQSSTAVIPKKEEMISQLWL